MANSRGAGVARVGGVVLLALLGCKEKAPPQVQPDPPTPKTAAKVAAAATDSEIEFNDRVLNCVAVLADQTVKVTVRNEQEQEVKKLAGWAYLYQGSEHVGRIRIEHDGGVKVGQSVALTLPLQGNAPEQIECDISEVLFANGEAWKNDNLVFASSGRPLAEAAIFTSPASLVWKGTRADPAHFTLRNETAREVKVQRAGVFYLDKDGVVLSHAVANVQATLGPSESIEVTLGVREELMPANANSLRAVVSEAVFVDGDKELWRDRNLEH